MDLMTKALDLMERADLELDEDLDCAEDHEDNFRDKRFQNENVYNRFLPYDIGDERHRHLNRIKSSLARCLQLDQATVYEWFIDLERFVDLYGMAFSKEDHIYFVRLQYELIVSPKSMDLYHICYTARCFSRLMRKRYLLTSDDLQLDWRPLYETYERLLFSTTEYMGLFFVPENLEANLSQTIRLARPHFPLEATQEMLDEWRPMLCPFSVSIQRAVTYLNLFLPTTLPPEHHHRGFRLWFDEILQLWLSGKVCPVTHESKLTLLLSRLSSDCMGFVDWQPYIPKIFNHFKACLNLNGGLSRSQLRRFTEASDVGPCVQWMVYMISTQSSCLDHISKLFKAVESYYHPSNTDRRWHAKLQQFLHKLPECYVKRLYRERYKKNVWSRRIPEFHRLTEEQTSQFVDSLLPVVLTSMFNQSAISSAAIAFKDLSVLRPEKVVPPLLERLYGSYETLTEPHRLLSSINCMASVVPAIVRPCKYFPEGPSHVIQLLLYSLPGIDSNDMRKCIAVFRFIATLAAHVQMKNYSYLVDENPNLTDEQQQLCLATAQFEEFVIQFLDRCFVLIENTATVTLSNLDQSTQSKNGEEGIIEAAISSVTLSVLAQASPEIQAAALDKIYYHVTGHMFDTKIRGKTIATLCLACAKSAPRETLRKFVPQFGRLILTLTDNEEVFQESILDEELLFSLLLMSELVRCNSSHILEHKETIVKILERALRLNSKEGYTLGCSILRHLLRALTNIACCDWRNIDYDDEHNQSTEEKWPFDNWGHTTHIKNLNLKWEIPGPESREFAKSLLETFLKSAMHDLMLWVEGGKQLSREYVQRSLHIVLSCLIGAASVLPSIESTSINLCPYEVPVIPMCISYTGTEPLDFMKGTNVRTWIVQSLQKVLRFIRKTNEDDTKSCTLICEIFASAITYFGYNKTELRIAAQRIKSMKSSTQNKLLGSKRYLRYLLVERVAQQHRAMLLNKGQPEFTQEHLNIFNCLFDLAQSHYVEVRVLAQDTVYLILNIFPLSENILYPMLVEELSKKEIEHKKFKGLLYLVVGRRCYSSIAIDPSWKLLRELWPAIVESPHSEKPSIVKLLDRICHLVQKGFDTFELRYDYSTKIKSIAAELWSKESIDLDLYKPPEPGMISEVRAKVEKRNQDRIADYENLVCRLVQLVDNHQLHWHRRIIAFSLFTHLMRVDHPLPLPGLNLCLNSLISDRLSIRLKALQLVAAQLKLHKRKHQKVKILINSEANPAASSVEHFNQIRAQLERISIGENHDKTSNSTNEQTPDSTCIRINCNSNKWMQYNLSDSNYSKEEWEKLVFIDKPYIGFYQWPKELKVYKPNECQPKLNRSPEEMNEFELAIYNKLNDEEFVEKLVNYFCFEDNKANPDYHRFDIKRPSFFKGLCRNYGSCMIQPFRKYLVEYSKSTCEHKSRFVIECLAGMLRGSKHWTWEMLNELREFVIPLLDQMSVTQENLNDWCGLTHYAFKQRDMRRLSWLFNYFMTKATSPEESNSPTITPFIQSSRLTMAQFCLTHCEWKAVDHVFPVVLKNLQSQDHLLAYANLRTCLAGIYSLIFMFDDPGTLSKIPDTLSGCPKRSDFIDLILPKLAVLERDSHRVTSQSLNESSSGEQVGGDSAPSGGSLVTSEEESQEHKDAIKLMKFTSSWITINVCRMKSAVPPDFFKLLPLICEMGRSNSDPELAADSLAAVAILGSSTLSPEAVVESLKCVRKIIADSTWHARVAAAAFIEIMVSSNLFKLLGTEEWRREIEDIVINHLICDERIEVRESSSLTLSGMIHCEFTKLTPELLDRFTRRANEPLVKKKHSNGASSVIDSKSIVIRHSGILCLCACVDAHPYTVPSYLPQILTMLSDHLTDPQPISTTIKKTMSNFRRTHHDNWQSDKTKFTDDQLCILADLLVSPSYYV